MPEFLLFRRRNKACWGPFPCLRMSHLPQAKLLEGTEPYLIYLFNKLNPLEDLC